MNACSEDPRVLAAIDRGPGRGPEAYRLCPEGCAPRYCAGSRNDRLCPRPAVLSRGKGYY